MALRRRGRYWLSWARVGLAASLLQSYAVHCLCSGNYGRVVNRVKAGFIPAHGARGLNPAPALAKAWASASARRGSLPGTADLTLIAFSRPLARPRVDSKSKRHQHVTATRRTARRDHHDLAPPASSESVFDVSVEPRPATGGGEVVGGEDGRGGGRSSDSEVKSLVDLVKLLHNSENPLWELLRFEGREASKQSHVSSMIHGSVLARTSLEDAVSCDVANKMATTFLSSTEVRCLMIDMYAEEPLLDFCVAEDLLAHAMQDTSLPDVLTAMLFHKGFTALTTYRLMHWLWRKDRRNLARYLQSICSEVCAADIHPAARIGQGILMASGCDIVVGETAVVGDGVCLLQGVTLGGTGNQTGDRHPKVGRGCHIGAGSSILGNIPLGEGSRIEAASVVVKPTKPYTINRGVPSQTVGWIVCDPYQVKPGGAEEGAETADGDDVGNDAKPRRMFSNYGSLYMGV